MDTIRGAGVVGCLVIDELTAGRQTFSGPRCLALEGVEARPFRAEGSRGLWEALQLALQGLRREFGAACILSRGTGCAAALALAEQLPVDRLALLAPRWPDRGGAVLRREALRLSRFARRNLPLCVSDILEVDVARNALLAAAPSRLGRLTRLRVGVEAVGNLFTNREILLNRAVSVFLRTGELPKSLAQNSEMCIIYG